MRTMAAAGFVTGRLKSITGTALAVVTLLYLAGLRQVAVGFILGMPVALFNLIVGCSVVARADQPVRSIVFALLGSALRLLIAMAVLAVAARHGLQAVLGALSSVLVELITYHIAVMRLLVTGNQRGG